MGIFSKIKQVRLLTIFFDARAQNVVICVDAQRERIPSRGGVCSISKAGTGEEKSRQ